MRTDCVARRSGRWRWVLGLVVAAYFSGESAAHSVVLAAPVVELVPEAPLEMLQIGALAILALLFHWRRHSGKA